MCTLQHAGCTKELSTDGILIEFEKYNLPYCCIVLHETQASEQQSQSKYLMNGMFMTGQP